MLCLSEFCCRKWCNFFPSVYCKRRSIELCIAVMPHKLRLCSQKKARRASQCSWPSRTCKQLNFNSKWSSVELLMKDYGRNVASCFFSVFPAGCCCHFNFIWKVQAELWGGCGVAAALLLHNELFYCIRKWKTLHCFLGDHIVCSSNDVLYPGFIRVQHECMLCAEVSSRAFKANYTFISLQSLAFTQVLKTSYMTLYFFRNIKPKLHTSRINRLWWH